jgi:predicted RNase H-like HicB family nuclease
VEAARSLHVEVHYEDGMYWAQVREWPGCFASGRTLNELAEALEDSIGLYMTPEDEEEPVRVRLHILEMGLTVAAEVPLVPARSDVSEAPMPQPPQRRDPHQHWHLRGFHRRGEDQ